MDCSATSLSMPLLYRDISAVIKRRLLPGASAVFPDLRLFHAKFSNKTIRPNYAFGINKSVVRQNIDLFVIRNQLHVSADM